MNIFSSFFSKPDTDCSNVRNDTSMFDQLFSNIMWDMEEALNKNMTDQEAFDIYNSFSLNPYEREFCNLVLLQGKNNVSEVISTCVKSVKMLQF